MITDSNQPAVYLVVCLVDIDELDFGTYTLATSRHFTSKSQAERYAAGIAESRDAKVITSELYQFPSDIEAERKPTTNSRDLAQIIAHTPKGLTVSISEQLDNTTTVWVHQSNNPRSINFDIPFHTFCTQFNRWKTEDKYRFAQDAFPTLSAEQREYLITGIDPVAWEQMFKPEPEFGGTQ